MPTSPKPPRISQKVAVGAVFVAVMFMSIMDVTIVNVALPSIGRTFDVAPTAVSAVSISYLVSLAVFIPASGWLGDRFGGKHVLLGGDRDLHRASALCGFAASMTELVLFRILQGVGGGMLAPVGMAMLFRVFPPPSGCGPASILTTPTALAPAIGPVLGGLLVTELSWRWVFFVNLPIGAAAFIFGIVFLQSVPQKPRGVRPARLPSCGIGFGSLMYGVAEGPISLGGLPTCSAPSPPASSCSVAWWYELRTSATTHRLPPAHQRALPVRHDGHPAHDGGLDRSAVRHHPLLPGRSGSVRPASGPQHLPRGHRGHGGGPARCPRHLPASVPADRLPSETSASACASPCSLSSGRTPACGYRGTLLFGMGIFLGQVFVPIQAASFATISPASTGRASTMFNAVRQLGGAIGVAAFTSVVVAVGAVQVVNHRVVPDLAAYHAAFLAAGGFALLGGVASLQIRDSEAISTMPGRRRGAAEPEAAPKGLALEG